MSTGRTIMFKFKSVITLSQTQ